MCSIKIFLPEIIIKFQDENGFLYGKIKKEYNEIVYYIVNISKKKNINAKDFQYIGRVLTNYNTNDKINYLCFKRSNVLPNFVLFSFTNEEYLPTQSSQYKFNIILYDQNSFQHLCKNDLIFQNLNSTDDNVLYLTQLIKEHNELESNKNDNILTKISNVFYSIITSINFIMTPILRILEIVFTKTAVAVHSKDWIRCLQHYSFNNGKSWTIVADILAGWIIMFWLLYMGDTSRYLMHSTEVVVDNLRYLLDSLKGSPVGLKLNTELNHFLLDCFKYHVDLWATFLVIVTPAIHYLFIPLAVIGCFGLSFQLAMLSDLLIVISLHAHCFYIYAALLYHIEIVGIITLWRIFLGRRKNILKERVESHEYTKNQLFLATMFFAAMLYILPTVFVYYTVFASLRFCVYCITYTLMIIQRKILLLPVYTLICWFTGSYFNTNSIELSFYDNMILETSNSTYTALVMYIKPNRCSPWTEKMTTKDNLIIDKPLSIDQFFIGLLKSDMLGFIRPKRNLKM